MIRYLQSRCIVKKRARDSSRPKRLWTDIFSKDDSDLSGSRIGFVDLSQSGRVHQLAEAVGISLPSVQNIKKAFGLVKQRRKKTKRAAATKRTENGKEGSEQEAPRKACAFCTSAACAAIRRG